MTSVRSLGTIVNDRERRIRMDRALASRIVAHYSNASALDRLHLAQRLRVCPYESLLTLLPTHGRLLDIGCGFGHFGWFLRETRPQLEYWGADVDARKVEVAQAGSPLRLFAGDVRHWRDLPATFAAVTMLDVLYLLPETLQSELFAFSCRRLSREPGAVLLLKVLPVLHGWARWRTYFQESAMIAMKRTRSSGALYSSQEPAVYARWGEAHGLHSHEVALGTNPPSTLLAFSPRSNPAAVACP